jgi:iron-sulfur cluster assembly protein
MPLTMTPEAIEHCLAIQKKQHLPPTQVLRLGVRSGGCAGMEYDVRFDEPKINDKQFEFRGSDGQVLKVVVDPKSYLFLNQVEVDYQVSFMDSKFVFNNPLATQSCGCGTSFKAD